jgi:hypothetical protein
MKETTMKNTKIINEIKGLKWCPDADLNHGHADFQSAALPTELSGHTILRKNAAAMAGL